MMNPEKEMKVKSKLSKYFLYSILALTVGVFFFWILLAMFSCLPGSPIPGIPANPSASRTAFLNPFECLSSPVNVATFLYLWLSGVVITGAIFLAVYLVYKKVSV